MLMKCSNTMKLILSSLTRDKMASRSRGGDHLDWLKIARIPTSGLRSRWDTILRTNLFAEPMKIPKTMKLFPSSLTRDLMSSRSRGGDHLKWLKNAMPPVGPIDLPLLWAKHWPFHPSIHYSCLDESNYRFERTSGHRSDEVWEVLLLCFVRWLARVSGSPDAAQSGR
jgi:hypothetical protein